MDHHVAIKFQNVPELRIRLLDTPITSGLLRLLHQNAVFEPPHIRDYAEFDWQRMSDLIQRCSAVLGWQWNLGPGEFLDVTKTTQLHKDLERYLARGYGNIPQEHDVLLHELHEGLHAMQCQGQRNTVQVEWFRDEGFDLAPGDVEFQHDNTLGAVLLVNPYVGHPPRWIYGQQDSTNIWQTCRFHDRVRPGLVLRTQGTMERSMVPFDIDSYLDWWQRTAPDFVAHHGVDRLRDNAGDPVIGYVVNNQDLLLLQREPRLVFESMTFNPDLELSTSASALDAMKRRITSQDYERMRGMDWPCYQDFLLAKNLPAKVMDELHDMLRW